MQKFILLILFIVASSIAMAEGKNEDLAITSKDEKVCAQQIQPIIDLWKKNAKTIDEANRLIEMQKTKGNCAARDQYRHTLGFN